MSEPFLAEIKIVGFNFAPRGWARCDGQILAISQNQSLFSLLGTTFGGDGQTTFGLPDLRGRSPMHKGDGHLLGQKSGEETHALSVNEMPVHGHQARASADVATSGDPAGKLAARTPEQIYRAPGSQVTMSSASVGATGTGQGHENMPPFLTLNFVIALQGLFPSRN